MITYYLLPFNLSQFRQDLSEGKKVALCDELLEMVKGNMKEVWLYKLRSMTVICITTDMNCKETMHRITLYFNCGKEKFCILLKIIVHVTEMIWTQNLMTLFDWFSTSPKFNLISFVVTVCFRSRHSPSVTVFDTVWVSRATGGGVPGSQRFLIYSDNCMGKVLLM